MEIIDISDDIIDITNFVDITGVSPHTDTPPQQTSTPKDKTTTTNNTDTIVAAKRKLNFEDTNYSSSELSTVYIDDPNCTTVLYDDSIGIYDCSTVLYDNSIILDVTGFTSPPHKRQKLNDPSSTFIIIYDSDKSF